MLPAGQCTGAVHVRQSSSCIKKHPTSFHRICGRQSVCTLTQVSIRLTWAACRKPVRDTGQLKQRLVEVRVDFELAIVNKAIDQRSKRIGAFVIAKGQHFEHSLFMISRIKCTDEMLL